MYVYCLFCQVQRCARIAQLLEIRGVNRAFSPKIVSYHWKQGDRQTKKSDLLPGYIFIFHKERLVTFDIFAGIDGVIRRVGRSGAGYELTGADLNFADKLYKRDGLVGPMKLIIKDNIPHLEDSFFDETASTITKIDYRKQRARIDYNFENMTFHNWIALEEIKRID